MARKAKPDVMDEVFGDATVVKKKTTAKKKDRTHLDLTTDEATAFNRFAAADTVAKVAQGKQKEAKAAILPILIEKVIDGWCEDGKRGENPQVVTDKGRAIFQAREKLHFELPTDEEGKEVDPADMLIQAGFDEEVADHIAEREFETSTERRFVNLQKLREASPEGRKVVDRLLTFVRDSMTKEERGMLLETITQVTVKEGFLDRAVDHAERDPVMLKKLLGVVRPEFLLSHIVWNAGEDDNQKATSALSHLSTTAAIPVVARKETFESDDRNWYAEADGNKAVLFRQRGGERNRLGEKVCNGGHDHARATCEKWMRDPDYRTQSVEKFGQ